MGQDHSQIRDLGERRFAWLLAQRGYRYLTEKCLDEADVLRPVLAATGKRPDFYAWNEATGVGFLAEVKSLTAPIDLGQGSYIDYGAMRNRIVNMVREAKPQLKPFADLALPRIVVFDNHNQVDMPFGRTQLIELFGELRIGGRVDQEGRVIGEADWFHGGGRQLSAEQGTYMSAMAINLPKAGHVYDDPPEKERPMRLQIVHSPYAGVPLPMEAFADTEDEHYGVREGVWVNLQSGANALE